ncbi:MAG: Mbeg1-like protein, partial [Anaerolineae bacterium]
REPMNLREGILMAWISRAAYGPDFQSPDFQVTAKFENKATDTQGLLGVAYGDTPVIAFRGSEETGIADWITDLKFVQQVFPYQESKNKTVKVHYGFIQAYKSVRQAVLARARQAPHGRIICTGHSLGGALATLAALDVQYNLPQKEVVCYTFGSPKVGNDAFAESYNRRVPNTFRFVNAADAIPQTPPGNYHHVGRKEGIGQSGPGKGGLTDRVAAHLPNTYIENLQAML